MKQHLIFSLLLVAACEPVTLVTSGLDHLETRENDLRQQDRETRVTKTEKMRSAVAAKNAPVFTEERERVESKNPEMVYIPGGHYLRGTLPIETDNALVSTTESPAEEVFVDDFFIDRFEFPNIQGKKPVGKIAWSRAKEICESFAKRLCSADEWEKACKGPGNQIYGIDSVKDSWDPNICDTKNGMLGANAKCLSGYYVYDMSGGNYEWTSTPKTGSSDRYIVKGGDKVNPEKGYRCSFGRDERGEYGAADPGMSFRCCKNVE